MKHGTFSPLVFSCSGGMGRAAVVLLRDSHLFGQDRTEKFVPQEHADVLFEHVLLFGRPL